MIVEKSLLLDVSIFLVILKDLASLPLAADSNQGITTTTDMIGGRSSAGWTLRTVEYLTVQAL